VAGRRGRARTGGSEFHVDERWVVSYMDMVTVLMCLFIVLYAMSSVDQQKFEKLKTSLATGFGITKTTAVDTTEGIAVPEELLDSKGKGFTASTVPTNSLAFAQALRRKIVTALTAEGLKDGAQVTVDSRGVVIGLVGSSAYFDGNAAQLRPDAMRVVRAVAPMVAHGTEAVTVEGHADPRGSSGPFATDWDLASARATTVLERLVADGVAARRISAVSFGSARPVPGSGSVRERNRRVDIVLHTRSQPTATSSPPATPSAAAAG
jgi:chemotaxis protein MotB